MNQTDDKADFQGIRRHIRQAMDQEWKDEGSSPEELELSRRLSDLYACELAAGRTPAEVEMEWEHKSAAEILRDSARHGAQSLQAGFIDSTAGCITDSTFGRGSQGRIEKRSPL